jgi:hydroxyacylglutathione hydrolase
MAIDITPISAFKDNYIWLIRNSNQQACVVVDPGDAEPVIATLQQTNLTLTAILITHHHRDHSGGINQLLARFSVPVFGPARETIVGVTHPLTENQQVNLLALNLHFNVINIPGHTHGHIAYYGHGALFCGDTLFTGGCGRLFEGTAEQMCHSLHKLAALPNDTDVYCGHEYTQSNLQFARVVEPSNTYLLKRIEQTQALRSKNLPTVPAKISAEKLTNPFLRCDIPTIIHAAEQQAGKKLKNAVEVFACLREWKNNF